MNVPPCKNASNQTCWYGAEKCWFKHTNAFDQENEINKNQEITSKIFEMMETFTQRIIYIENQMKMTSH